jgi:hypothetical protein
MFVLHKHSVNTVIGGLGWSIAYQRRTDAPLKAVEHQSACD